MESSKPKRVSVRIGDIFEVAVSQHYKKYFQYVADDLTQLNSNVIRVFKIQLPSDTNPSLEELVGKEVEFYSHCSIRLGVKLNLWQKVGNSKRVDKVDVWFRNTNDYGHKAGEEPIKISKNWHVWKINDERFTKVGELKGEHREAEIGIVFSPYDIVERMKTGSYGGVYPGFE